MASFRYLGEQVISRPYVVSYGPTLVIRVPKKDGSWTELTAADPDVGFPINDILPFDFTDERSLRYLRVSPRFQEVV